jgi:NTP pyrophosphatase (non-canonical NTP hydrolase)
MIKLQATFLGSMVSLKEEARTFMFGREWDLTHTPRNLLLEFIAEVGELSIIIMSTGDKAESSSVSMGE